MIFALKITGDKLILKKIGIERVPCKIVQLGHILQEYLQ